MDAVPLCKGAQRLRKVGAARTIHVGPKTPCRGEKQTNALRVICVAKHPLRTIRMDHRGGFSNSRRAPLTVDYARYWASAPNSPSMIPLLTDAEGYNGSPALSSCVTFIFIGAAQYPVRSSLVRLSSGFRFYSSLLL